MEQLLIPMVGDHVTYLDCISCQFMTNCIKKVKEGKFEEHNRKHLKEGIIDKVTGTDITIIGTHFTTIGNKTLNPNGSIIKICRNTIVNDKVPENIITLEF